MAKKKESTSTKKKVPISKLLLIIVPVLCILCACATYIILSITNKPTEEPVPDHTVPAKITNYLHEISYNDYAPDPEHKVFNDSEFSFGCSSVRNGNFYGRNFDFVFNDIPEFVVRVAGNETRHASIGIATNFSLTEQDIEEKSYTDEEIAIIPNFTLDGINDAGVIVSDNIAPEKDTTPITGTNIGAEDLELSYIPRFLLDNANSADHAIELLRSHNIINTAGTKTYLHFMIADNVKTYIAEIINNNLVVEEKQDDAQIMTNYFNNLPNYTNHAAGIERYNILKENYAMGNSMDGMWHLMQKVRYSNAYRYSTIPAWDSEETTIEDREDPEAFATIQAFMDNVVKDYWIAILGDVRAPANPMFWHTTHNSIYNIANKKLRVTVQEDYAHYYEFDL